MSSKKRFSDIKKIRNWEGLLGFIISEEVASENNKYESIGRYLGSVVKDHPDSVDIIEETVEALCGCNFETIRHLMLRNREYFNSL